MREAVAREWLNWGNCVAGAEGALGEIGICRFRLEHSYRKISGVLHMRLGLYIFI